MNSTVGPVPHIRLEGTAGKPPGADWNRVPRGRRVTRLEASWSGSIRKDPVLLSGSQSAGSMNSSGGPRISKLVVLRVPAIIWLSCRCVLVGRERSWSGARPVGLPGGVLEAFLEELGDRNDIFIQRLLCVARLAERHQSISKKGETYTAFPGRLSGLCNAHIFLLHPLHQYSHTARFNVYEIMAASS